MDARQATPGSSRHVLGGTARVFLAEALVLPTGLLTAALLSRKLGTDGYGLFALAASLVTWIEWSVTALFAGATIKLVGQADDWRPIGTTVTRLHLLTSGLAAVALWLLAPTLAELAREPSLGTYLRLFALDIPIYSLAHAHRNILIGQNGYGPRALASAARWIARLVLIALLVELGWSVEGAILGSIGASLVELAIGRAYVRPAILRGPALPARQLLGYAVALFLFALGLRLYERLDLFALKLLGGSAEQAGIYGAAQNLALVPGIFSLSFSPLLLGALSRAVSAGDLRRMRATARDALRLVFLMLPFAGLAAGAAGEVVELMYGSAFVGAGPPLGILIFGAVGLAAISAVAMIATAAGHPRLTVYLTAPLLVLATAGHLLVIPRFGPLGAATVTATVALLGALAGALMVWRRWQVAVPLGTLWRSVAATGLAYELAVLWPAPGALLLVKLPVLALVTVAAMMALGELTPEERAHGRAILGRWIARRGAGQEVA